MDIIPQHIFLKLESLYLEYVSYDASAKYRREIANTIVISLKKHVFDQKKRRLKESINIERQRKIDTKEIEKPSFDDYPYKNNIYDDIKFLCDQEFIPKKFEPSLLFILSRGHNEKNSETLDLKANESQLSTLEILNQVLQWFFEDHKKATDFIVQMNFMDDNNELVKIQHKKAIKSFLNIKSEEKNLFYKYQTCLSFFAILSPLLWYLWVLFTDFVYVKFKIDLPDFLLESPLLSIIISISLNIIAVISLFNTYYYTINKKIQYYRYLVFSLIPFATLIIVLVVTFSLINSNKVNDSIQLVTLDSDPNTNGEGFVYISPLPSIENLNFPDKIELQQIPNDINRNRVFNLNVFIKNISPNPLDSIMLYINKEHIDSHLRFHVMANDFKGKKISDIVRIKNLNPTKNYSLRYRKLNKVIYRIEDKENQKVFDSIAYSNMACKIFEGDSGYGIIHNIPSSKNRIKKIIYNFQLLIFSKDTIK